MTRCIEEGDMPVYTTFVFMSDFISADMLSDAAGFFFDDVCFSNIVKKRRFSMIDVSHDSDDGLARSCGIFFFLFFWHVITTAEIAGEEIPLFIGVISWLCGAITARL